MTALDREFRTRGLALHYVERGRADAPPLVLIHGGMDHARAWDALAEPLAEDHRVLAIDLRGHGDSDWSPGGDYEPFSFVADLAAFFRHVVGGPASVVGHSMGARLAFLLAGARPEAFARLVAIEGLHGSRLYGGEAEVTAKMGDWVAACRARLAAEEPVRLASWLDDRDALEGLTPKPYPDAASAVARLLRDNGDKRLTQAQAEHLVRTGMRVADDGTRSWKFDPQARQQAANEPSPATLRSYYARAAFPVLHVFGAESWAYPPADEDLAAFPQARLAVVPGAGHWVHLNQPAEMLGVVRGFLAEDRNQAQKERHVANS